MIIRGINIWKCEAFHYLESIIPRSDGIKEDIDYRNKTGWMRWKMDSKVFCDKNMPTRLKEKCCKIIVWLGML